MEAARCGSAAGRVRAARLESAQRVSEVARDTGVDVAVLAGDTFENHGVASVDVSAVVSILGSFPCPVFVLPGNHDPDTPGSVWEHGAWQEARNVTVLKKPEALSAGGCVLYPCPLRTRWGSQDPTAWIPAGEAAGSIRIGVAHGALSGTPGAAPDHPIAPDAAWKRRLDYLALGHYHSTRIYGDAQSGLRMAYSGTHETTSFGEDDSGNVLIVSIAEAGARPSVRSVRTGRLQWSQQRVEIDEAGQLRALRESLERLASPERLLELRIGGVLFEDEQAEVEAIQALGSQFLHARVDSSDLAVPVSLDDLPEGPVKETARRLQALCDNPGSSQAARVALQRVLRLARGVSR
jgi:DNA repair exonuclease SbcCD nuclease subunit